MTISNPLLLPSMHVASAGVINPQSLAPGSVDTGWIAMKEFAAVMAQVQIGTISASGTVDAKLEQATDAAGSGAKDIPGKAIAQKTQVGGDSDSVHKINCHESELDVNGNFDHVRLTVTTTTAAALVGGELQGHFFKYGPGQKHNASNVGDIIN